MPIARTRSGRLIPNPSTMREAESITLPVTESSPCGSKRAI
jgi:hypothetical protein